MNRLAIVITLLVLVASQSYAQLSKTPKLPEFAQTKNQGRYQLCVVPKFSIQTSPNQNVLAEGYTGGEYNYILLDTQSGKMWAAVPLYYTIESTKSQVETVGWKPLYFLTKSAPLNDKDVSVEPPK